jgi:hypothetical protein
MRTFPSELGVFVGDRLTGAASADRAALIVLAVRAHRDDGIGAQPSITAVEARSRYSLGS